MDTELYHLELPLLRWTANLFDVDFSGTFIIAVQHVLPTTVHLVRVLIEKGLIPSNLIILGKCYSTDPIAFDLLVALGVNVCHCSKDFNSHHPYDEQFDLMVKELIDKILREQNLYSYQKIIILDDGGHLLEGLQRYELPIDLKIIGIEQTSAGYWRTKSMNFNFPIINLARCHVKLKYETPLIINRALGIMRRCIARYTIDREFFLLLGNGFLGEKISQEIRLNHQIIVYDHLREKSDLSSKDLPEWISKADVIIGCTGNTSISNHYHHLIKKEAILISTSSSDREFDAVKLRQKIPKTNDCHADLEIDGIKLINCGFPVNFNREYTSVDGIEFQLTRSLILAALIQALKFNREMKGYVELDLDIQEKIIKQCLN